MGKKTERQCEKCGATIPKEWDNEHHYGTCPSCKRGSNFILVNPEMQKIADAENKRQKIKALLDIYNVVRTNPNSGVKHVNCVQLAKLISTEENYNFITMEDKDSGKQVLYYYINGIYQRGGENRIRAQVDRYLDELSGIHKKNEVVDYIKNMNYMDRERLEPPLHLINVKNGIYNMATKKLEPHTPEHFFLNQIPVEYHKDSKCPRIEKFMEQVLYDDYVGVAQEMFGYCLYRNYRHHKAFLMYGGGRNGKSTLLAILEHLIGEKNYTNNSLNDLLSNRYASSDMYGMLANFGSEISGSAIMDTAIFKHLTGNDNIRGEKKYHGGFSFKSYAKLIFNCNYIPYSKNDKSKAYFDRWIILVFPKTFEQDAKETDTGILEKLTTKEELEGCLVWAIAGLDRLLKQDHFSYNDNKDENEIGERYEALMRPEKQFIKDNLVLSIGSTVESDEVYNRYNEWAVARKYPIATKTSFSRGVKYYLYDPATKTRPDVKPAKRAGKTVRVYVDVAFKDVPMNTNTLDTFDDDKPALGDKLQDALSNIRTNKQAGYNIDMDWLQYQGYSDTLINGMIESGLLIRLPDGGYDIA